MLQEIASRFKKKYVYLDWASAAPVSSKARKEFVKALSVYGNPSSPHAEGEFAHVILEEARKKIARLASVKTDGVIFTSGATESNALAIRGHVQARINTGASIKDMHLLYLPMAHSSIVETMEDLRGQGAHVEELVVKDGAVDLVALKNQLRPETALISMDVVCGETGTKYATLDVRRLLDAYHRESILLNSSSSRPLLHIDGSQAPLTESINHTRLGADLMTLDAQKVGGVRGIGVLIRAHSSQGLLPIVPIMQGGGQEFGLRPGTENPAAAKAFASALSEAEQYREVFKKHAGAARVEFLKTLAAAFPKSNEGPLENVGKDFSPHILNLSFVGRDTDYAAMLLSRAGFAVSTKSACETDAIGSRVIFALTGDEARALSTIRISWGPTTSVRSLHGLARELIRTINFLDAHSLVSG